MIIIDYSDKRPIYEQIADRIRALILGGVLEADEKLPSVRSLAVELSINPNTIQRAYGQLEQEGLLYTVKGRGNFVRKDEALERMQKDKLLAELEAHVRSCMSQGIGREELKERIEKIIGEAEL